MKTFLEYISEKSLFEDVDIEKYDYLEKAPGDKIIGNKVERKFYYNTSKSKFKGWMKIFLSPKKDSFIKVFFYEGNYPSDKGWRAELVSVNDSYKIYIIDNWGMMQKEYHTDEALPEDIIEMIQKCKGNRKFGTKDFD